MRVKYLIMVLIITALVIACNEDSANEPEEETKIEIKNLFNISSGSSYSYSIDTLNLITNQFENVGTRNWQIGNKVDEGEFGFYDCLETYNILNIITEASSKFRLTNNTVDFYSDSSGISELIPDSIEVEILLDLDQESRLIEFPYDDGHEWNVYNGAANFGTFKFNIFRISGKHAGIESVQLAGLNEIIETEKFEYEVVLNIPNMNNPFVDQTQSYKTYIWISPTHGIVKMEGCNLFINPITGGQFDDADSNKVSRHTLTGFSVN